VLLKGSNQDLNTVQKGQKHKQLNHEEDKSKKRPIQPDSRYQESLVTRFVNNLMWSGKKSGAFTIFYDAMDLIEKRTKEKGYDLWKEALNNVMPGVEVRSRRVGGATFQIPTEIRADRKISLTMKWIIQFARKRKW